MLGWEGLKSAPGSCNLFLPLISPLHSGLKAFRKCSQVGFSVSHCHTQAEWQRAQQAPLPEGRMPVSFYNRYVCMDDCSVCPGPTTEAYTLCFSPLPLVWQLHCSSVDRNSGSHHGIRNKLAGRHMLGCQKQEGGIQHCGCPHSDPFK